MVSLPTYLKREDRQVQNDAVSCKITWRLWYMNQIWQNDTEGETPKYSEKPSHQPQHKHNAGTTTKSNLDSDPTEILT